jgi:hypothetical protein
LGEGRGGGKGVEVREVGVGGDGLAEVLAEEADHLLDLYNLFAGGENE